MLDSDANDRPPAVHERPGWLTYAQAGELLGLSPEAVRHRARRSGWRTQPGNDGRTLVLIPDGERPRPPVRMAVQSPVRTPDHQTENDRVHARSEPEIARLIGALEAAIAAAGERAQADAATIATLQDYLAAEHSRADSLVDQLARSEAGRDAERSRADRTEQRAEAAEQGREAERARADALRDRLDVLQAQLATMEAEGAESDVVVAQLTAQLKEARLHAEEVLHAAETRQEAEATARRSLGRLARLRAAWRGE